MKLSDLKGLSPRARSALERVGITTLEAAQDLSREELVAFKGVGEASVRLLTDKPYREYVQSAFQDGAKRGDDAAPMAAEEASQAEEEVQHVAQSSFPKPFGVPQFNGPEAYPSLTARAQRADAFFRLLCEHKAPSKELIKIAWDLALAFEQEGQRADGAALELHDGLEVRLDGRNYTVRTSWKAGEEPPKEYTRLALVPVEDP